MDIKLTHSYSSIKMYENCPKRYYHQRVMKEVQDTGSDATKYGERVHASLEHRLVDSKPLSDDVSLSAFLSMLFRLYLDFFDICFSI